MIVRNLYKTQKDGCKLYITYSDKGFLIKKLGTNEIYEEAIDVESAGFVYIETDKKKETVINDLL